MTSQKKKSTNANRKKLNLLLLLLNLVLLGLLAVFMLNRPSQSGNSQKGTQTSQSTSTAKWKTYEEAYKAFTENALPAKKVVWLTFDDGNEDFYTIAYPILKKYKAKATNNIITGFVKKGNAGNLTVKQMKEMMAHGMSFQSHTVNHPDLSATDKATQKVELTDSIGFLENKLNTKVNTIAYPSGRYNQTTLDLAKKSYKLGLTTNEGLASAKDGLLSLNRVRILPTTTAKGLLSEIATDNK